MPPDVSYLLNEAENAYYDKQWDVAIEKLQQVLQQDPSSEDACNMLADCFARRGLLSQVINTWFSLMDVLESQGELNLSIEIGNKILKLQPENDKARMRMILVYRRQGNQPEE
ncbi:MAG: tetratricopeptide repeat protein, partial [Candidatus Xenobia bacterium]